MTSCNSIQILWSSWLQINQFKPSFPIPVVFKHGTLGFLELYQKFSIGKSVIPDKLPRKTRGCSGSMAKDSVLVEKKT